MDEISASSFDIVSLRRRTIRTLSFAAAASSIGAFASLTIGGVLGREMLSKSLASLPLAFFSLGIASTPIPLSRFMSHLGRRPGLSIGYLLGAAGSVSCALAVGSRSVALLLIGMFLIGAAYSTSFMSRYAAADLVEPSARGKAIGRVTWALVVGALVGPNLLAPLNHAGMKLGLGDQTGALWVGAAGMLIASGIIWLWLKPDPLHVSRALAIAGDSEVTTTSSMTWGQMLDSGQVKVCLLAMGLVQFVMVLVMSISAVHIVSHHGALTFVGIVLSSHFVGMFGLSPLVGIVVDRFGRRRAMGAGQTLVLIGGATAALFPLSNAALIAALFTIGCGWNLNIVGGSALLIDAVPQSSRPKIQGLADFVTGSMSVLASVFASLILAGIGFGGLGLLGAVLMLIPLAMVRKIAAPAASAA
ncbi:MAG: MFS transporter [Actinomycetota bacterium]|nr:MFS transporter [Actinomycetota bacterium]